MELAIQVRGHGGKIGRLCRESRPFEPAERQPKSADVERADERYFLSASAGDLGPPTLSISGCIFSEVAGA
jgi:hypothetical protein